MENNCTTNFVSGHSPMMIVKKDNGIDALGIRALVSSSLFVCAPNFVMGSQVEDVETDYCSLQEGPLVALSPADLDSEAHLKQWLPSVTQLFSSSAP